MPKALTARTVEFMKPGAGRREIPDGHMPGLYFVLQPSGSASWAVRYRHAGRSRKLTLGGYPALQLADARQRAAETLRAVAEGRDPADEKQESRRCAAEGSADLIPVIVGDFITRHVRPNNRSAPDTERLLAKEIVEPWKARKIQSITKRDIIDLLDSIIDRGAPHTANRVFSVLRKMMSWTVERGILAASPCVGLKPPTAVDSRDRVLRDDEIRWLWNAAGALDYPFGPLFRLLLLTGQRRDEVAGMRWGEIDLGRAAWTLPRERSKNAKAHEIPLSAAAIEILNAVPVVAGRGDLVFTTTGARHVSGYSNAKIRLDRLIAEAAGDAATEIQPWRLHDLRRTAASGMARLGQPVHVVEAVLNHRSGTIRGVAAVYNRYSYADEKRRALEAWANFVLSLADERHASNVVALRG